MLMKGVDCWAYSLIGLQKLLVYVPFESPLSPPFFSYRKPQCSVFSVQCSDF